MHQANQVVCWQKCRIKVPESYPIHLSLISDVAKVCFGTIIGNSWEDTGGDVTKAVGMVNKPFSLSFCSVPTIEFKKIIDIDIDGRKQNIIRSNADPQFSMFE